MPEGQPQPPEQFRYQAQDYNLRPERIRPFLLMQRELAKRELEKHPEMSEAEWVDAYSDSYRKLVDAEPNLIDLFEDPTTREEALRNVANRLFH
jgi:hypothetical protein